MATVEVVAPAQPGTKDQLDAIGVVVREGADLLTKWMELVQITVPFTFYPYGPCSKPETEMKPILLDAMDRAKEAFIEAGALRPVQFNDTDIKVYEFPRQGQVLFVFYRTIAGKQMEFSRKYDLTPQVIGFLKTTGRWAEIRNH